MSDCQNAAQELVLMRKITKLYVNLQNLLEMPCQKGITHICFHLHPAPKLMHAHLLGVLRYNGVQLAAAIRLPPCVHTKWLYHPWPHTVAAEGKRSRDPWSRQMCVTSRAGVSDAAGAARVSMVNDHVMCVAIRQRWIDVLPARADLWSTCTRSGDYTPAVLQTQAAPRRTGLELLTMHTVYTSVQSFGASQLRGTNSKLHSIDLGTTCYAGR